MIPRDLALTGKPEIERERDGVEHKRGKTTLLLFDVVSNFVEWTNENSNASNCERVCNFGEPQRDTISVLSSFVFFQLLSINILGG